MKNERHLKLGKYGFIAVGQATGGRTSLFMEDIDNMQEAYLVLNPEQTKELIKLLEESNEE